MHRIALLLALTLFGCSGVQRPAAQTSRISIELAAHGLAAVDDYVSRKIRSDALAPHTPGAIHDRWHVTVESIEDLRQGLIFIEGAIDRGSVCLAREALPGLTDRARDLTRLLGTVGLQVPESFAPVETTLFSLAIQLAPQCPVVADGGAR